MSKNQQFTRAMFSPSTMDAEKRTVDVVFATPTPVLRYSWMREEYYQEVLDMDGANLERASKGLPVLNNHSSWGSVADTVIGRAENVRREGDQWIATIRFSNRDNVQRLIQDIRDGIIIDISFGYSVDKVERTEKQDGQQYRTYMVRQWTPNEISFVTIPADPRAGVRSQGAEFDIESLIDNKRELPKMTDAEKKAMLDAERKRAADITKAVAAAGLGADFATRLIDEELTLENASRMIAEEKQRQAADPQKAAAAAVEAERKRAKEIREAVRTAKLDDEFANTLIDEGKSADEARAAIIAEWAKRGTDPGRGAGIKIGADEADKYRQTVSDAIQLRANPGAKLSEDAAENKRRADAAREFRGMTLMDMGKDALERAGEKVRGLTVREQAQLMLGLTRGGIGHSTSDFPIILGDTINKSLRQAYDFQAQTFKPFSRQTSLRDFKPKTVTQLSDMFGKFEEVKEGGEYTYATFSEGKETYKLAKYGKKVAITWEALINDDLDAFSRVPAAIAQKAAQLESDIVWGILLDNAAMGDGTALFHADHGNLAASGTTIDEAALSAARLAMRTQKSQSGDFINVYPRYMLIGPARETVAQKILQATIVATKTSDTNVFRGFTDMIVEPRITGNKWFLAADPSQIDTIEYAYLEGEGGLFTEQRQGFDVDGIEIKARLVFGAKAIDWRGFYYNPGN